ncbi:hypothetical protein [Agrobacterium sp. MS2]|uniref:hypothetical protein n=1 Tax=Agrobacterium sp. MS2 TaxID=1345498 RepID=UPI000DB82E37|nr:hypothetical protein [Agrobacterium sp. MS2]PZP72861.1 MAG: hypothetical protein DI604_13145 [Delftia acidovorans]RAL95609.1 hypothetical protein DOU54_20850 [Agrobacterium sp. MS2]
MSKRKIFNLNEKITSPDLTDVGIHAKETTGNIVGDAIGYPNHYATVTVSEGSAVTAVINPGRLFINDKLYDLDEAFSLDLTERLPLVLGDTVWVALLLRGATETETALRNVRVDADTGATVNQVVPKTEKLTVQCVPQSGIPGPTPLKPTVAAGECIVAWVLLSQTGIQSIEMHTPHRVKTLHEVEGRVTILEARMDSIEQVAASLRTDLSAISAKQREAVRPEIFNQVRLDISAIKRLLRVFENEPRAQYYDPALVKDGWDTDNSLWLARIAEGIRFQFANFRDSQLALANPANPDVTITNNLMLPKWTEEVKLSVSGGTGSKNISQLVHTEVTAIRREISRSSVSYGPIVQVCQNQQDWAAAGLADARAGATLAVAGETFQVVGQSSSGVGGAWNADPASTGHKNYDVQSVSVSTWTEVYWDYVTETFGLNGSVYGQTFLNSQAMIMTGLNLRFTRVGTDGDVHVCVCEVGDDGAPRTDRVLERATVTRANLSVGKVRFGFRPMLLEPGKRYAFFLTTTGNHQIAFVSENKFAQGSLFQITDGIWAQGSATEDLEFDILGAKFASTRTVVEFDALTLDAGMSYLRLVAAGWAPSGTSQIWQWQPQGDTEWYDLSPENADILYGLPPLIRLRLVMVGTTDLAPAIVLDNKARGETGRTRGDIRALTEVINFGVTTTKVTVDLTIDRWVNAEHTAVVKLISGGVTRDAFATSTWQDPDNPLRRRLTAVFDSIPSTTSAAVQIEGTKTGVDEWFGESLFVMAD